MSSRSTAARRRRANQRAGAGLLPLFLGQMCCPCGIDIAGPLPAVVHLMQAAAQCPGADRDTMALLQIMPELEFGQLRGVAERMNDAVAEGGAEFCCLACTPGGEETLLPPDLAPNRGEGVSEGRPLFAVPGSR